MGYLRLLWLEASDHSVWLESKEQEKDELADPLLPFLRPFLGRHWMERKFAQMLFTDLFKDYFSTLRPVEDTDKVLNVTLQITLSQIKDMDERNQILTAYLWIRQLWHDAYLCWDRERYDGLDSIRIPSRLVWRPDIVLYNKAQSEQLPWKCGKNYIAKMALITASTVLTIMVMNIHFCGEEAKPVPRWVRLVILDYMSKILLVYDVGESCVSPQRGRARDHPLCQDLDWGRPPRGDTEVSYDQEEDKLVMAESGLLDDGLAARDRHCPQWHTLARDIEYIASCLKAHRAQSAKDSKWKKVARVMDRFFMWLFFLMVFGMSVLIVANAV
ncbi:neuronal acetylcholine receptor subunit alpha-9 [Tachyglossus aculeatus]|uniref:neuronal acetylcholine receptor subunit alpha-9 n=1 Tax=Tachyglossus aculeatus TaxID=9261 RepID=UPI0018F54631|nr:neuronal acetylcholine receptor subunit alpha-9 [Tachyglossus aculeatus]